MKGMKRILAVALAAGLAIGAVPATQVQATESGGGGSTNSGSITVDAGVITTPAQAEYYSLHGTMPTEAEEDYYKAYGAWPDADQLEEYKKTWVPSTNSGSTGEDPDPSGGDDPDPSGGGDDPDPNTDPGDNSSTIVERPRPKTTDLIELKLASESGFQKDDPVIIEVYYSGTDTMGKMVNINDITYDQMLLEPDMNYNDALVTWDKNYRGKKADGEQKTDGTQKSFVEFAADISAASVTVSDKSLGETEATGFSNVSVSLMLAEPNDGNTNLIAKLYFKVKRNFEEAEGQGTNLTYQYANMLGGAKTVEIYGTGAPKFDISPTEVTNVAEPEEAVFTATYTNYSEDLLSAQYLIYDSRYLIFNEEKSDVTDVTVTDSTGTKKRVDFTVPGDESTITADLVFNAKRNFDKTTKIELYYDSAYPTERKVLTVGGIGNPVFEVTEPSKDVNHVFRASYEDEVVSVIVDYTNYGPSWLKEQTLKFNKDRLELISVEPYSEEGGEASGGSEGDGSSDQDDQEQQEDPIEILNRDGEGTIPVQSGKNVLTFRLRDNYSGPAYVWFYYDPEYPDTRRETVTIQGVGDPKMAIVKPSNRTVTVPQTDEFSIDVSYQNFPKDWHENQRVEFDANMIESINDNHNPLVPDEKGVAYYSINTSNLNQETNTYTNTFKFKPKEGAKGATNVIFYPDPDNTGGMMKVKVVITDADAENPAQPVITRRNKVVFGLPSDIVENLTAMKGQEIEIPVRIDQNEGFDAAGLTISYNNKMFDFVSFEIGDEFKESGNVQVVKDNAEKPEEVEGQIQVAFAAYNGVDTKAEGTFGTLKLKVRNDATAGKYSVGVRVKEILANDKSTSVSANSPTMNISLQSFKKGDVNGDNRVDLRDVMMMLEYVNEDKTGTLTDSQKEAWDVNGDKAYDLLDAKLVLDYYNGTLKDLENYGKKTDTQDNSDN